MNGVSPRQDIGQLEVESATLESGVNGGHATILVVEDEDFVREVTCEVLMSAGYKVLGARTATEALRLVPHDKTTLDLLLTDIVLPGRNGHALARDLQGLCCGLKTIFISGYPENELATHDPHGPKTSYLPKPFSVQTLLRKVSEVLQNGAEVTGKEMAKGACGTG